jgi:SAM-dependent methyltransferase
MLDMACGKGRYAKQLADDGYQVTGLDLSENSIKHAKQYECENLHFYQHDMRLPYCINHYDYCFNFFTSFGYFNTNREHNNAIRTMAQAIKKDGILVIDFLNVHYAESHFVYQHDKEIEGINYHITKWMDEDFFYKKIEVEAEDFEMPHIFTEKVAKFSLGDFTEMLAYQHLQVQQVFGDYQLNNYHVHNSPRMIIIAKKNWSQAVVF